ncbi:nucleoside deaminase [Paenibacillus radicis (ex Gao et al. 2016)]|uniref:tRNA-specific adenosine deaminase n=1 Tax=Paenibacillus radicis (ex Gao et al. 2016) TaxID=1737354 RepID=A0A917M5G0_9BACL|nr:nucleoside deaminase [Paenibacillus radicis (ex Gao et al. 2016)]GGG76279.1 tRNA-specific adenosine deaminase [Paenibacillus radicis (ex Gao et al. 2016)]
MMGATKAIFVCSAERVGSVSRDSDQHYLRRCIELSRSARENGNTPFGAILVGPEGDILLEQENVELTERRCTGHAETALMEKASHQYPHSYLWQCTLYTTFEPCAMCAGAIYWGNVGRVVYASTEEALLKLTGSHEQNPTFNLPCRDIFARGQKAIKVAGPFPELEAETVAVHDNYWL